MIRYHARWVLPITAPPIEHGTVAVEGRSIAYRLPDAVAAYIRAQRLYRADGS